MKRILFALLFIPSVAFSGSWDDTVIRDAGRNIETYTKTVTTYTATALWSASTGNEDVSNADIFNNSAYTLWVGSNTTDLATRGFPILSSTTYTVDGRFTGTIYGLVDAAAGGNTNVRAILYLTEK